MNWRMHPGHDNGVVYPRSMADIIEELRQLGKQIREADAHRDQLIAKRKELALKARAQTPAVPWRKMAVALEMTEHGLIKATKDKLGDDAQK